MAEDNSNIPDNGSLPPEQSVSKHSGMSPFHLHCLSRRNLGSGIGKSRGSYFFIWIITCLFYVGPFIITYTFFALMAIAMFLPLWNILRRLGC